MNYFYFALAGFALGLFCTIQLYFVYNIILFILLFVQAASYWISGEMKQVLYTGPDPNSANNPHGDNYLATFCDINLMFILGYVIAGFVWELIF